MCLADAVMRVGIKTGTRDYDGSDEDISVRLYPIKPGKAEHACRTYYLSSWDDDLAKGSKLWYEGKDTLHDCHLLVIPFKLFWIEARPHSYNDALGDSSGDMFKMSVYCQYDEVSRVPDAWLLLV